MRHRLAAAEGRVAVVDASYDEIVGDVKDIKATLGHPRRHVDGREEAPRGLFKVIQDLANNGLATYQSNPPQAQDSTPPASPDLLDAEDLLGIGDVTKMQMVHHPEKLAHRAKSAEMQLKMAELQISKLALKVKVAIAGAAIIVALAGLVTVILNVWLKAHGH